MGLWVTPTKNDYYKKNRLDFVIENWQEDLDLEHGVFATKQS